MPMYFPLFMAGLAPTFSAFGTQPDKPAMVPGYVQSRSSEVPGSEGCGRLFLLLRILILRQ
jgi:hypothetical protein